MNIVLVNGSPHKRGITDTIMQYIVNYIPHIHVLYARDIAMRGCIHCGYCKSNVVLTKMYTEGACTIATHTDKEFFDSLLYADSIVWIAPIYFYHLPAVTKAIIDRSQALYYMQSNESISSTFYPILHAGREHGKKLFEGALLTFRYFAQAIGSSLGKPLLLRGTDTMDRIDGEEIKENVLQYCDAIVLS